jgi:hypothetical protein
MLCALLSVGRVMHAGTRKARKIDCVNGMRKPQARSHQLYLMTNDCDGLKLASCTSDSQRGPPWELIDLGTDVAIVLFDQTTLSLP